MPGQWASCAHIAFSPSLPEVQRTILCWAFVPKEIHMDITNLCAPLKALEALKNTCRHVCCSCFLEHITSLDIDIHQLTTSSS